LLCKCYYVNGGDLGFVCEFEGDGRGRLEKKGMKSGRK